jgi:maleate cis-trans isomerase
MIGWRARLGVFVPSANTVLEPDMYRMAPPGVSVHFSRVRNDEDTPEELEGMIHYVPKCCEELSHARMDVYAFGCTGGSLLGGLGYDQKIIKIMEEKTGKPASTTATAVIEAFKELRISRVSVVTPYEDWLNEKEKQFFAANGVEVLALKGLGIREGDAIASVTPEKIYRLAREVDRPAAQAVFMSCTNLRAVEVLEVIEGDLGKPALSSNQATLWAMLKLARVREPIRGFGSLLTRL